MKDCIIRKGIFDRWHIHHATNDLLGWSGAQWVSCSPDGFPTGMYQICNFETEQEAREYCQKAGLTPE